MSITADDVSRATEEATNYGGSLFWLKVDSSAASITPTAAVIILARHARRLGIACEGDINGLCVHADPDCDPVRLAFFASHAWAKGAKLCMDMGQEAFERLLRKSSSEENATPAPETQANATS